MNNTPRLKVISLGWGVQSWVLAAMAALDELEKPDFAIHSDTTWERSSTYEFAAQWTPWLEKRGVRVVTVNDAEQAAKVATPKSDIPAFTGETLPIFIPAESRDESSRVVDEHGGVSGDAHTTAGSGRGQLRRQCTHRWKIAPMRRYISKALQEMGVSKSPGVVEQWLGITLDEIQRAKDSDVKYVSHRFPLLEKRMNRADCIAWLREHNLPSPGKSACVFCPYQTRSRFEALKRAGGPDWETATRVDEAIRDKRPPYPLFIHPDRIPLREAVVIPRDFGMTQGTLFDEIDDRDAECDSGYCFL